MNQLISIVIPVHNEEKNIPLVYRELKIVFEQKLTQFSLELLFINDGSSDASWEEILTLAASDPRVKGINFTKNFGFLSALQAGFEHAKGDAIVSMDGDLQHPPELLPVMVEKWQQGSKIVSALRQDSEGASWFKNASSRMFYKLLNALSSLKMLPGESDFRLLDRKVADVINRLPEQPKFYRGIMGWVGFRRVYVPYKAPNRKHGSSSFTVRKMLELARVGITSFSVRPLKFIIGLGVFVTLISFLGLMVMAYLKIFVNFLYISNIVVIATILLFCTGMLISIQGVIAVYLVNLLHTAQNRPSYIVEDSIGVEQKV